MGRSGPIYRQGIEVRRTTQALRVLLNPGATFAKSWTLKVDSIFYYDYYFHIRKSNITKLGSIMYDLFPETSFALGLLAISI
jgi:hypothetical protein